LDLLRFHHFDVWPGIAQLLVPCSTSVLWTRSDKPSEQGAFPHGTLVDRRLLDQILRASATAAGADCLEVGANLPLPLIERGSVAWCLSFNQSAVPDIRSRFLVDAAGRSPAIRRTRLTLAPTTLALTASVVDARLDPGTTCVEALRDGWLWAGKGFGRSAVVTLFVSPRTVRGWPRGEHSARFLEMLYRFSLVAGGGTAPRLASNFRAHDATAAERTPFTADGLLRVGDAALALDPLSSQGIQRALVSAGQAATVLHTMLVRQESAGLAGQFYRSRISKASPWRKCWPACPLGSPALLYFASGLTATDYRRRRECAHYNFSRVTTSCSQPDANQELLGMHLDVMHLTN
jgi:flavin-dependent dehydrogenase